MNVERKTRKSVPQRQTGLAWGSAGTQPTTKRYTHELCLSHRRGFSPTVFTHGGAGHWRPGVAIGARGENVRGGEEFLAPYKRDESHALLEATRNWKVMH